MQGSATREGDEEASWSRILLLLPLVMLLPLGLYLDRQTLWHPAVAVSNVGGHDSARGSTNNAWTWQRKRKSLVPTRPRPRQKKQRQQRNRSRGDAHSQPTSSPTQQQHQRQQEFRRGETEISVRTKKPIAMGGCPARSAVRLLVALPMKDRVGYVQAFAASLRMSDLSALSKEHVRLLVHDDGSREFGETLLRTWFGPVGDLTYHRNEQHLGPDKNIASLVLAFLKSSSNLLVLLDSDSVLHPQWLNRLLAALPRTDGVLSLYRSGYTMFHKTSQCEGEESHTKNKTLPPQLELCRADTALGSFGLVLCKGPALAQWMALTGQTRDALELDDHVFPVFDLVFNNWHRNRQRHRKVIPRVFRHSLVAHVGKARGRHSGRRYASEIAVAFAYNELRPAELRNRTLYLLNYGHPAPVNFTDARLVDFNLP